MPAKAAKTTVSNLLMWGLLGALYAASLLGLAVDDPTISMTAAVALFAVIGATFVAWYRIARGGAWLALVILGATMSGVLTWATVERVGCPAAGKTVTLKEGKPPVSCDEVRAGYLAMASFFYVITILGASWPYVARKRRELDDLAEADDSAAGIALP